MEAVLSSSITENRFPTHRKNAASVLCARTLPKQWRESMAASTARHHTYPRATPPKRASNEHRNMAIEQTVPCETQPDHYNGININAPNKSNGVIKLKGSLTREVADAWKCRVGPSDRPAPADCVQSIFNDIELYPTKNQVFEMLVCSRECARRKSLTLTFGEFCVFAADLRRCSRQARQTSNKPETRSHEWNVDKELRENDAICKYVNGSEASPPSPCEVFLGGSCNPTTWRSDIAIPILKRMGITYFNPQVDDWSTELMEVEYRAKAAARALLFVLDSETRAVAASVEAAHLAAAPRDLLLVLRPYTRHQKLGEEVITDQEYVELSRARATLQEAVERRGLPAFTDIPAALRCAGAVLRGARTHPRHTFGHTILRLKRAYDAAGGRNARLPRARAADALRDVTGAPRELADRCLPTADTVDFETFCAAVAELAADAESEGRNRTEGEEARGAGESPRHSRDGNGMYNDRLRAYGRKLRLLIPKNGESRSASTTETSAASASDSSGSEAVFTPGTERRLERLPAMLSHNKHDVYLGGSFPSKGTRPEDLLRREGFTYVAPRANDYTRMFSAPARRSAPAPPDKPRHDKKPRPSDTREEKREKRRCERDEKSKVTVSPASPTCADDEVQLRERSAAADPSDRLSASDFYKVTEDLTPQPFKGTYDEELLLGSRVLVFSLSAEAPCFSAMVLAAHYMGLRPAHTVLLVQPMDHHLASPYSEAAVRDYNRGRHYLRDLAMRSNVPVYDNVEAAVACAVNRLRNPL